MAVAVGSVVAEHPGRWSRVLATLARVGRRTGRRLAWLAFTLLLATLSVFLLLDLAPGDVAERIAGPEASPEVVSEVRAELDLDAPVWERYVDWATAALRGDLGDSLLTGEPVTTKAARALPATVSLLGLTLVLASAIALVAGCACALRPGSLLDRAIVAATTIGLAVPSFWVGLLLVSFLAVRQRWFPAVGYAPLSEGVGPWLEHLVLPVVSLTGLKAAEMTRQLRGTLQDVLRSDYILAARMKGLGPLRLVGKHALKNAMIPVVTVFGVRTAQLLGGTIVVERVFNIDGLGGVMVQAVQSRDMPVVLGVVVLFAVVVVIINLLVDASYAYFDPRLK